MYNPDLLIRIWLKEPRDYPAPSPDHPGIENEKQIDTKNEKKAR